MGKEVAGTPLMVVECMHCRRRMGSKPCVAAQAGKITHSICEKCWTLHYPNEPIDEELRRAWREMGA